MRYETLNLRFKRRSFENFIKNLCYFLSFKKIMKRIFFGIISFLFMTAIFVSVLSVEDIDFGASSMLGIGAWLYLFFF